MKKGYTLVELIVVIVIGFIFMAFIALFAVVAHGCHNVSKTGLKPQIEKIWEGPK